MKSLLQFLFGKSPEIFDKDGQIRHNLPKEKWQAWDKRYHDKEHDWKQHSGVKRSGHTEPVPLKSSKS